MSVFSEKIDGMLADMLYEDGYRNEEVAGELETNDEDLANPPALLDCFLFSAGHGFTFQDAEAMNNEALELGVIKEPLVFPYMSKKDPNVQWNRLYSYEPASTASTEAAVHLELVSLSVAGEVEFVFTDAKRQQTSTAISQYLDMNQESDLKQHLSGGYCAYVATNDEKAYWVDVPSYFLSLLWAKERYIYQQEVARWELLSRTIDKAKKFNEALQQQQSLAQLPFRWTAGKYNKPLEVAETEVEDGSLTYDQYHDSHLVLGELYIADDYHLMTNDILCLADGSDLMSDDNDDVLEYECQVDGLVLKRVPHKITCKQCQAHINKILNLKSKGAN